MRAITCGFAVSVNGNLVKVASAFESSKFLQYCLTCLTIIFTGDGGDTMNAAMGMKMVNGRVNKQQAEKASRVLQEQGLTISAFIRNSLEHIANTGTVPKSGLQAGPNAPGQELLRSVIHELESLPMPGKDDYPALSEDDLIGRLQMERYGY